MDATLQAPTAAATFDAEKFRATTRNRHSGADPPATRSERPFRLSSKELKLMLDDSLWSCRVGPCLLQVKNAGAVVRKSQFEGLAAQHARLVELVTNDVPRAHPQAVAFDHGMADASGNGPRSHAASIGSHARRMTVRRCTVEHVFGTFEGWMGTTSFLMRRLPNVSTETSLTVLAYNLKRVLSILGFAKAMKAMQMAGA